MFDLGKQSVDHKCPTCGRTISFSLEQLAKEASIKCRWCNESIQLKDSGHNARNTIKKSNDAFKKLERTMKSFGKR